MTMHGFFVLKICVLETFLYNKRKENSNPEDYEKVAHSVSNNRISEKKLKPTLDYKSTCKTGDNLSLIHI